MTACCRETALERDDRRGLTSMPSGSAASSTLHRRCSSSSVPSDGSAVVEVDVEVLGRDSWPGGQRQPEGQLRPGREALGVGDRAARPAQRPLPDAGHVAVAREADLAQLREADADPHAPAAAAAAERAGTGTAPPRAQVLAGALAAAGRRHGRGDDVLDAVAGAGAAVVAGGPAAVRQADLGEGVAPVLPEEVLVQAGREVVPRQDLVLGAVAVDVPLEVEAGALASRRARGRSRSARTTPGTCRRCATRPR